MVKLTISPYYTGFPRILHSLSPSSLESQNTFKEIIIDSSIPNPGLTKSFNNPSLMAHVLFASVGEQFLHPRSVNAIGSQKEAILVKRCMTVFGGLCAMMAALILSILVGALVGLLARDAIVGDHDRSRCWGSGCLRGSICDACIPMKASYEENCGVGNGMEEE
ncbi:uncharacterized protein RSE6_10680 [Rhynchosporium secalis]|uniref:Uncharacterized protein n=1 Tax=Rhynchosporium secalis TaxID=38038 RepID=A0A1E1ML27_RHYSE|nr:uncharacterized protein RSE6_10680 [Rhynchosporium secalis]